MTKKYNPVISIRLPQQMVDIIDSAVDSGMYRSRADYIMAALRDFQRDDDPVFPSTAEGKERT
ncbi:MAG: type II toxin-antitoxin system ParD family antitoxin [Candidatus Methanomethylophilaceae archaeon]